MSVENLQRKTAFPDTTSVLGCAWCIAQEEAVGCGCVGMVCSSGSPVPQLCGKKLPLCHGAFRGISETGEIPGCLMPNWLPCFSQEALQWYHHVVQSML